MGLCNSSTKNDKTRGAATSHTQNELTQSKVENTLGKKDSQQIEHKKKNPNLIEDENKIVIAPETLGDNLGVNPNEHYTIIHQVAKKEHVKFYLVKHKESGLKRFMKELTINEHNLIDDVKRKNDILRNLEHPKILKIFEVYYFDNKYYTLTEYFERGDLGMFLDKNKKFSEKQVASIIFKVLLALQYAHENNIIHGYLYPYNILIEELVDEGEFDIKVKEFSFLQAETSINLDKKEENLGFLAPEILLNKPLNKSVDLWSVGVITYMMLDGKSPFEGKNLEEKETNIKNFKSVKLTSEKMKKATSMAREFIKKLLVFEPEKRITALEALNDKWFNHYHLKEKNKVVESSKMEHFLLNMTSYGNNYKLQQVCIALIVHNLPQNSEIKELEKAFTSIDVDMNGKLSKQELVQGFKNIFKNVSNFNPEEEVDKIFRKVDIDNSGNIGYIEFICACIDRNVLLEDKYLKFAFSCFDDNNSGFITCDELKNVLTGGGKNEISKEVILKIMRDVDINDDKKINYDEFKKMMENIIK
jgi:calcium-dependent protein kinase